VDDITGDDDQAQGAAAPQIIWRGKRPFVVDNSEGDGITYVVPLKIVPECFFRLGVNLALPDWTLDCPDIMDSAPLQFLALLTK
jgi:hypothetical protein